MVKCKQITQKGYRCNREATRSGFCTFHFNINYKQNKIYQQPTTPIPYQRQHVEKNEPILAGNSQFNLLMYLKLCVNSRVNPGVKKALLTKLIYGLTPNADVTLWNTLNSRTIPDLCKIARDMVMTPDMFAQVDQVIQSVNFEEIAES